MQSVQAEYIYILLTFFVPRLVYDVIGQDNLLSPQRGASGLKGGVINNHGVFVITTSSKF